MTSTKRVRSLGLRVTQSPKEKSRPRGRTTAGSARTFSTAIAALVICSAFLSACKNTTAGSDDAVYEVAYYANGATSGSAPKAASYAKGDMVTVAGNPRGLARTGFGFAGWSTKADGSGSYYTGGQTFAMDGASVKLYAVWVSNALGRSHTMILLGDGSLYAAGCNNYGQYGNGTGAAGSSSSPSRVMSGVAAVFAGAEHNLFLKSDGSLWGAGYNSFGQLGCGTTESYEYTAVQVSGMTGGVAAVSAGFEHSMILKADGGLWGTGKNNGQLGYSGADRSTPLQIMTGVAAVSAGYYHTMILKTDGSLWATGDDYYGQLGDGHTLTSVSTPFQLMTGVAAVSAGSFHTMILKTDGSLWATGYNHFGQLGDGTTTDRSTPVQVMTGVAAVSAGGEVSSHTMILKTDGSLWATGDNDSGQLGDGTTTNRSTPVQVMSGVVAVFAGGIHSLILKADGSLWATGNNYYGQLGDGTTTKRITPVQIRP
jgi:alpha-tubulin suppressor-like RCC1 family protein